MKRNIVWLVVSCLITVALVLASCAPATTPSTPTTPTTPTSPSTPAPTPTSSWEVIISISGFDFNPKTIKVSVGTTVKWTNHDSVPHTVTSDSNLFESGNLPGGATFRYTFNKSGTYDYHCVIHPSMRGTIIVE
ncbi:cupredoxin family copper-binding protein [Chloroflexota bacterium]